MKRQTHDFAASASGYFCRNRSLCRFSMTTMTSAQPRCPAVTLMRALSSVPAERTSHAGSLLKIVSAVRLRRRLRLHTKRIFVRSLTTSKISLVIFNQKTETSSYSRVQNYSKLLINCFHPQLHWNCKGNQHAKRGTLHRSGML